MSWVPQTNFEEEVVNLQPHHDFIYGALSEPQVNYPRPKSHIEYAANKKLKDKKEQEECRAGKFNEKLRVIQQVQRMACTKSLGDQPAIEDWEDNSMNEQETIGMMRYCGMGVSVEQPLDEKLTIATYPVEKSIKLLQNGRRKVALFFDDDIFKLKDKVSDTSPEVESCNSNVANKFGHNSLDCEQRCDNSFNTTSSLSANSVTTVAEYNEHEKLLEDLSFISLDSNKSSSRNQTSESFQTADKSFEWKPVLEDENILSKKENWPVLSKTKGASDDIYSIENNEAFSEITSKQKAISKRATRVSFLKRFMKSEDIDAVVDVIPPEPEPITYAAIAKAPKQKEKKNPSPMTNFPPHWKTRRTCALKSNVQ